MNLVNSNDILKNILSSTRHQNRVIDLLTKRKLIEIELQKFDDLHFTSKVAEGDDID